MNGLMVIRVLAALLLILAFFLVFPGGVAWWFRESTWPFFCAVAVTGIPSLAGLYFTRNMRGELNSRDGFMIVSLGWLVAVVAGAVPYVASGLLGWVDAIFEASAGYTTTGSSILTDVEVWPKGMLFWRSLTQWLGGMGMLLLALAILPALGVGGMQIMKAEVPGPSKDRFTPRLISTARILWGIYLGYTLLATVGFYGVGMDWLEALDHAMTALSTGGFSTRNASFGAFSAAAQWVAIVFMTLGGINFMIHYHVLFRRNFRILNTSELHVYLGLIVVSSLVIALSRLWTHPDLETALREGFFQVVSIMTTTGFATSDYAQWPFLAQAILGGLMVVGGMSGSTGGGVKVIRVIVLLKTVAVVCRRLLTPLRIIHLQVDRETVPRDMVEACVAMILLAIVLVLGSMVILILLGMDPVSAFGAALTCFSNVGPGFGTVGPASNFAAVPELGKILLSILMVVGRLEIYTVVLIFTIGFWRRR
ncbi:MAG: TrkH family potassium uptake protein [Magnetococcus sp. THC-1_WYH]